MTMDIVAQYLRVLNLSREDVSAPTPEALTRIHVAHAQTLPFCSVALFNGKPLDPNLNVADIADQVLTRGVGGICFEHVALMNHVLRELGFETTIVAGEVWHGGRWTPPNAHGSLLVTCPSDGSRYFVDIGYALRPLEPLSLRAGEHWQSDGRGHKLEADSERGEGAWRLSMWTQGPWQLQHRFTEAPCPPEAIAATAHWLSQPESPFLAGWVAGICRPDGAHVTVGTGLWAGSSVPPTHAKIVVRKAVPSKQDEQEGGAAVQDSPAPEGGSLERVLPLHSASLRDRMRWEMKSLAPLAPLKQEQAGQGQGQGQGQADAGEGAGGDGDGHGGAGGGHGGRGALMSEGDSTGRGRG